MISSRLHPTALEDIERAALWIAEKVSADKAGEWTRELLRCIQTLENMPERCPLAPENGRWGPEELRQLLFQSYPSKYRILFHVRDDVVHVLQVRHGARRGMDELDGEEE